MIVVEMCKNIPTTIARMILKLNPSIHDPELKPRTKPRGVVNAKSVSSSQDFHEAVFATVNKVINAIATGIL